MKKISIVILIICMLLSVYISVCASDRVYDDVSPDAWYEWSVKWATQKGLMSGVGDNLFKPEALMTREQVAMVLYNWRGNGAVYNSYHFNDVKAGTWYANAIEWLYRSGFAYGINESEYGVGRYITRQDLVTLIYRVNQKEWETVYEDGQPKYNYASSIISSFNDYKKVSSYAYKAMAFATGLHFAYTENRVAYELIPIIKGDNNKMLNPQKHCTRAEATQIFARSYDSVISE